MKPLELMLQNAARSQKIIVLSEGADPRVVEAAIACREQGVAKLVLVGSVPEIEAQFAAVQATAGNGIEIHDPTTSKIRTEMADQFYDLRKHKGMTREKAEDEILKPHVYAAMLVRMGEADGTLGGAVMTTGDIVRAAIQVIGTKPGSKLVSSFFLMLLCQDHHPKKGAHIFADCGLVIDPTADEMCEIALASSHSFRTLIGETPKVAMLSFSTQGSAAHPSVSKVSQATTKVRAADPSLIVQGEIQFDAAFVPSVAASKLTDSALEGDANIFVFPNLDSGNIAYKIAQRVGGAIAIGPILQGLAKPANDLSRGCSAEDILHMIAVTAAQADLPI